MTDIELPRAPRGMNYLLILTVYLTSKYTNKSRYTTPIKQLLNFLNEELGYKILAERTVFRSRMKLEKILKEQNLLQKNLHETDLGQITKNLARTVNRKLSERTMKKISEYQEKIKQIIQETLAFNNGNEEKTFPYRFITAFEDLATEYELILDYRLLILLVFQLMSHEISEIYELKAQIFKSYIINNFSFNVDLFENNNSIGAQRM